MCVVANFVWCVAALAPVIEPLLPDWLALSRRGLEKLVPPRVITAAEFERGSEPTLAATRCHAMLM